MKVEYVVQKLMSHNCWVDDDQIEKGKDYAEGVHLLHRTRGYARKTERLRNEEYRLIKRCEEVYEV